MDNPPTQDPQVDLKLPVSQVMVVMRGLNELKMKEGLPVAENIQRQTNASIALQREKFEKEAAAAAAAGNPPAAPNRAARRAAPKVTKAKAKDSA